MQTFLPLPDFRESARVLDYRRLGKQRVEAMQILNTLLGKTEKLGWRNHPAVKMWQGYEPALVIYAEAMIAEWVSRGYRNNIFFLWPREELVNPQLPSWIGDPKFHAAHRSNLLRKDPIFYSQFGWSEPADLPYVWPTKEA
jgi:hypothetical protein